MAQRTLAEAVAEIRLSDRKLTGDLTVLRQRLVQAAQQIEKDVQVNLHFAVDDKKLTSDLARLKQATANISPVVTPTLDPTQAKHGIDQVGQYASETLPDHFEQAGEEAGHRFGTKLVGAFKGVSSAIGVVAGGFIAGSLVTGFQRLTTIEDATASLTVQLGDATKAAHLLDEVLGVVRGTPFNLDQFARAAANMVSFGVEVQKIPGFLRAIGEAAASQGSRANEVAQRLSLIFGQITTANRIGGEEILQFSEAGVNALAILGNHFGKTTTEIREMISKGVVPAKQALDILAEGILKGTTGIAGTTVAFEGTMAKLRNTLTGSIGGFKAATARFGVELLQPFKEGIIAAFQGATTAIDDLGKRAREAFGGIAKSDFMAGLLDALKNLPVLIDKVVEGLGHLGPALAPLLAFVGASGLGAVLGLVPALSGIAGAISPVGIAIGALVAFTPELREGLLPILQEIFDVIVEFGAVAGDAIGKVSEALVPLGEKLIHAFGQVLPVVRAARDFGEGVLGIAVPAISALASVLNLIPVEVITALIAAFAAFKAFDFVETSRSFQSFQGGLEQGFGKHVDTQEEAVKKSQRTMAGMEAAFAGAFSGMALASKDGAQQIVGAIGSIGSIAAGFATGGPWGGAAATFGVAVGVIVGHFTAAAREAAALQKQIDTMADSFSDATLEILKSRDALVAFSESGLTNLQNELGKTLLENKDFGELIKGALVGLNLPASGPTGGGEILKLFQEMAAAAGDLNQVPDIMDQLTAAFGDQAPVVADLIEQYGSVGKVMSAIESAQQRIANASASGEGLGQVRASIDPALLTLIDKLDGTTFTAAQQGIIKFVADFQKAFNEIGSDDTLTETARKQIDLNSAADEGHRVAVRMAEAQLKLHHETGTLNEVLQIEAQAVKNLAEGYGVVNAQVRDSLKAHGATQEQIVANTKAAKDQGVQLEDTAFAMETLGKEGVDAFHKMRDANKDANAEIDDTNQGLSSAEIAAKNLATAVALSKQAAKAVSDEVDKLHKNLADISSATSLLEAINKVKAASTNIVNEKDLAEREKAEGDLADTRDKILKLQADVAEENAKAAISLNDLQGQRAKAVALGATNAVAAIDFDIAHIFDKAHEKEDELAAAEAKATELAAKIAALPQTALLQMQQLIDQANFTHVSLLDLIVSGATPESAEFQDELTSMFDQEIDKFVAAAQADPKNAFKIADMFQANVKAALLASGMDEETAQAFIDKYFNLAPEAQAVQKAAKATTEEYRRGLQKAFVDDPELGKLAKNVNLMPTSQDAAIQAALARDDLQAEFDKQNIAAGLEIRPLTDEDIKMLQGMELDAVTDITSVAMNAASVDMTTQSVTILTGGIETKDARNARGETVANLGARGPGGGFLPQREGGVLDPAHVAQIVSAGMYRVFAEPETHGEGYVPLSPFKRTRSLGIMAEIADIFGYQLEPKGRDAATPMPTVFAGTAVGTVDADAIGRAVAHHTARVTARRLADGYDHAVHVDKIIVEGARSPKRTAVRLVSELAELALKRR